MEITSNTTGMPAGVCVWMDPDGRDHCVVVVKGTFDTTLDGTMQLAGEQQPLVYADEHYGDPETTPIRYENDFAPGKPRAEVIVVGKAVAPQGVAVARLNVALETPRGLKQAWVTGERRWVRTASGFVASDPVPFVEMPLTFDRAFGGVDDSQGPNQTAAELRNLVGVGFNPNRAPEDLEDLPLPNIAPAHRELSSPRDTMDPVGFGIQSRGWQPRIGYAGTYDQRWLDETCPFLPPDFDLLHFMSAPEDQWLSELAPGSVVRCIHMAADPVVTYTLPAVQVPVEFRFFDHSVKRTCTLDTLIAEPHLRRAQLVWRATVPLGKRLVDLREIVVGTPRSEDMPVPLAYRDGKPHFRDLSSTLDWLSRRRRSSS